MNEIFMYGAFWTFVFADLHAIAILVLDWRGDILWNDSELIMFTLPLLLLTGIIGFIYASGWLTKAVIA